MSTNEPHAGRLQRSVGFWGLMFVSLGSMIGSGWLLGALTAAQSAGPASILSWMIAGAMLSLLALTYAELGATYPVAGGAGRFPYYSHGPIAGFTAGWAAWLQAVFIAPIEVLAAITYINSVGWVNTHFNMITKVDDVALLNGTGLVVAVLMMIAFAAINLLGAKFLSDSNAIANIWKTAVPLAAIVVVAYTRFTPSNFHAGGGFLPFGFHGVFAALTGGVVFAMQGFEQATQLAGEARDPRRDLSRAILTAMAVGGAVYSLLQIVMVGGFDPRHIVSDWKNPLGGGASDYGAWYSLALALGLGWLAKTLLVDAVISPAATGVVYVGTSARLSYALGEEREMPSALSRTNPKGVPVVSIVVAAVVGIIAFGPFKSWAALVNVVTGATAIMYGFAPLSLAALHRIDPDRKRAYRVPSPAFTLPAAFCSANLIIYWGGFSTTWKLVCAMIVGLGLFAVGAWRKQTGAGRTLKNVTWMAPWFAGHVFIGWLGRYGGKNLLPDWVDIAVVIVFSVVIFYAAVALSVERAEAEAAVAKDAQQLQV